MEKLSKSTLNIILLNFQ